MTQFWQTATKLNERKSDHKHHVKQTEKMSEWHQQGVHMMTPEILFCKSTGLMRGRLAFSATPSTNNTIKWVKMYTPERKYEKRKIAISTKTIEGRGGVLYFSPQQLVWSSLGEWCLRTRRRVYHHAYTDNTNMLMLRKCKLVITKHKVQMGITGMSLVVLAIWKKPELSLQFTHFSKMTWLSTEKQFMVRTHWWR